jgi:glycine/D-amino acid oxidase-like deaminating enzyme
MGHYDLIVIGAGIVGAACADAAAAAGLRVVIVEPGPIGGGATGAAMGHLVAMDGHPAELTLARYSQQLWERYADLPDAEFNRCGTLWVARSERELAGASARIARLAAAGLHVEALNASDLARLEPGLSPMLAGGMLVSNDAAVYPPRMALYLVQRAEDRGAVLELGRRARRLDEDGVTLDDGSRLRGVVLVAAGCASVELLPQLPVRPRKGHLVVTDRYPGLLRHQVVELGYSDSVHEHAAASVAFNVQPRLTGQILIGSSREFDTGDASVSRPMLRRMLQRAFEFMPGLCELNALRVWTGLRPASADGLPYLGPVDETRRIWVAAGHEGLGITTALGSARLLLDLLLGREPAIDPKPYLPARMTDAAREYQKRALQ